MFVIFATKALTDGTKGFRFNVLGTKGIVRIRKNKSNGWFKRAGGAEMVGMHFGKLTVYRECPANRVNVARKLRHFAG